MAVTVAVPADSAVTTPWLLTLAILSSEDDQVMALLVAFSGETSAFNGSSSPLESSVLVPVNVIFSTFTTVGSVASGLPRSRRISAAEAKSPTPAITSKRRYLAGPLVRKIADFSVLSSAQAPVRASVKSSSVSWLISLLELLVKILYLEIIPLLSLSYLGR